MRVQSLHLFYWPDQASATPASDSVWAAQTVSVAENTDVSGIDSYVDDDGFTLYVSFWWVYIIYS